MRPKWLRVSPTLSRSRSLRSPVRGSSICDVEAMVYSHTASPVSIQLSASGTNSIFLAIFMALLPSCCMA